MHHADRCSRLTTRRQHTPSSKAHTYVSMHLKLSLLSTRETGREPTDFSLERAYCTSFTYQFPCCPAAISPHMSPPRLKPEQAVQMTRTRPRAHTTYYTKYTYHTYISSGVMRYGALLGGTESVSASFPPPSGRCPAFCPSSLCARSCASTPSDSRANWHTCDTKTRFPMRMNSTAGAGNAGAVGGAAAV